MLCCSWVDIRGAAFLPLFTFERAARAIFQVR